ncbi:diaminopimelate epimerase [Lysinibacillus sp. KU-BSD001]|uniref:diaminopimelate epimerase n=1 Tax=Lysinibacillus sp. KU-BSD001 TaxID=3141328 RepID=UPI0036E0D455
MDITLLKVHGSGNTFYLYETGDENEFDWSTLVSWLCHKENEDGADGLLIVCPSRIADAKMRVINADGSEASMCGNGLRCVARYVCEKLGVDEAVIETMKANLRVKKEQPLFKQLPTYSVEISPVSFALSSLPMWYKDQDVIMNEVIEEFSPTIQFTAVSVPNPHLIGIVGDYYIKHKSHHFLLAQYLNSENEFCYDGVNVSYVYPMTSDSIFVRTYERGVGFTNACGTAMTASALVATLHGIVESTTVTVYNPGGFVKCIIQKQNDRYDLLLIGNATVKSIYKLEIIGNNLKWLQAQSTNEQVEYEECIHFVEQQTKPFFN